MEDNLRVQIYNNLIIKDTDELLEIWESGNTDEWNENVFEIIREILSARLGGVPPQSQKVRVSQALGTIEKYLENDELDRALKECELAIQLDPDSAPAYNYLGVIYDEMGQLENAIACYQRAIQLDDGYKDAWDNLIESELELEEEFERSPAKQHLDQALEHAYNDESELAMEDCETAKQTLPGIAIAYNYLGLILETLNQLEPAIDAYLTAIQCNPRFYAARENLANARVSLEEEQYLRMSNLDGVQETKKGQTEFFETLYSITIEPGKPIPGWMYLDADAFLLRGWAGHRTRPGRSGYDPLDRDFELAHVEGVIIHRLFIGRFRTRNPVFLFIMACMGVLYSLYGLFPLVLAGAGAVWMAIMAIPYAVLGMAILVNVYLSLRLEESDEEVSDTFV